MFEVTEHLLDITQGRVVVKQARQAHPGRGIVRRNGFEHLLRLAFVRLAEFGVGQHLGHGIHPLRGDRRAVVAGHQALDQGFLLFGFALLLVHGGQLDIADIGLADQALADLLDLIQVLVVVALAAVEQDLRQIGLGMALLAPGSEALLYVHIGIVLWILQVQHHQRQQAAGFSRSEGLLQ